MVRSPLWRHAILAGAAGGLAASPLAESARAGPAALFLLAAAGSALALLTPRRSDPRAGLGRAGRAVAAWLVAVALISAAAGLVAGGERLRGIDAGALRARPGTILALTGTVVAPPKLSFGEVRLELDTARGRVGVSAPGSARNLEIGDGVRVQGLAEDPQPWLAGLYRRHGIVTVLTARELRATGRRRSGLTGELDSIRRRAEAALGRGMRESEAALARGFVLGQDDEISPATAEDFRRSGLAHLLAVSGQNVLLLCLLAWPFLALAGLTLRARLVALLALIAIYVPLTGAGPSIQRAGVMGAAAVVATLAGRPESRWYALALAAVITLAINPRSAADVGWQLSFAAVIGLIALAGPLSGALARGAARGSPRRALADGAAATIAATLATAPLGAAHFGAVPLAALPANLLAFPAVAPAMWMGMLSAIAGQIPAIPVEPLNWLNSLCLAYIEQVAHSLAAPDWAVLDFELTGVGSLVLAYIAIFGPALLVLRAVRRRGGLGLSARLGGIPQRTCFLVVITVALAGVAVLIPGSGLPGSGVSGPGRSAPAGLTATFLDVGQGDAILLRPPDADPVLIDAGPPGAEVVDALRGLGVSRLSALIITHDQSDHTGGAGAVLGRFPVGRLLYARAGRALLAGAATHGASPLQVAEGSSLRAGTLSLQVLWPPRSLLGAPIDDPNRLSLVVLARWRHLSILLTGDAEAESVPIDPGPVDVLKVAHHGSEDAGLGALLRRSPPDLAVISVGENSYGHPAPRTLAELSEHGVPVLRTDRSGPVTVEAGPAGWAVVG